MRIVFTLPGSGDAPVGGFKVVYQYAGGLAARGHRVSVLHPARLGVDASAGERSRGFIRYVRGKWSRRYDPRPWFPVDPRVELAWIPSLAARHVPDTDVVVATSWQTAEWVAAYPARTGRKFYLIQHLETWSGPEERVLATWRLPLRKIVIARWLQTVAEGLGQEAFYVPNGLDFAEFGMDVPPEERHPLSVLMMYHNLGWKGSSDGLAAVSRVKGAFPDLALRLFGVPDRPDTLPKWVSYHHRPTAAELRRLYNEAAIFVAPSRSEGWGLPACEAMACGAALVGTAVGGHLEFAKDDDTALLSPPERPDLLALNLSRLLAQPELRARLARRGAESVRQFTWPKAIDRFESILDSSP